MSESAERFGIYRAWKGRCAWCREPMYFKDCHKEHLIPRDAKDELDKLIKKFGLPTDFKIESFENWVPSVPAVKGTRLLDPSPNISLLFSTARSYVPLAEAIAKSIDKDGKSARVLASLAAALEAEELTQNQIMTFMEGLPPIIRKAVVSPEILHIAPGWDVVERGGRVIEVRGVSAGTYNTSVRGTIVAG